MRADMYIYIYSLPNVVVGEEPATGRPTTRDGSETLHHITCCSSRVMSAADSHTHLLSTFSRPSLLLSFLSHQRNIRRSPSAVSLLHLSISLISIHHFQFHLPRLVIFPLKSSDGIFVNLLLKSLEPFIHQSIYSFTTLGCLNE